MFNRGTRVLSVFGDVFTVDRYEFGKYYVKGLDGETYVLADWQIVNTVPIFNKRA